MGKRCESQYIQVFMFVNGMDSAFYPFLSKSVVPRSTLSLDPQLSSICGHLDRAGLIGAEHAPAGQPRARLNRGVTKGVAGSGRDDGQERIGQGEEFGRDGGP